MLVIVFDVTMNGLDGWMMFALPPVVLVHIISFISTFWSADIAAFINYSKVQNINNAFFSLVHLFSARELSISRSPALAQNRTLFSSS